MSMKTPISSDVWETKRSQIAILYKDEEWPLKQVIKKIRTDDFDPTETQLRSRLKKWGVTKPSRRRRKKPSNERRRATYAINLDQTGLQGHNGASQLHSLSIPASSPSNPGWNERKQPISTIDQSYLPEALHFCQGNPSGSGLASPSQLLLHTPGAGYAPYPIHQLPHDPSHPPTFHPYCSTPPGTNPVQHSSVETGSTPQPRSPSSSGVVSSADSFLGEVSIGWKSRGNPAEVDARPTVSPPSHWTCTPPETCPPYSPTCLYLTDSVPVSPTGYPDYAKQFLPEATQKFNVCQSLSPASDVDFFESVSEPRVWRRGSSLSDQDATIGSLVDCNLSHKQVQSEITQRATHEALLGNRQDLDARSPTLLPELTSSGSDSDSAFHDLSPVNGPDMGYLLPSPDLG